MKQFLFQVNYFQSIAVISINTPDNLGFFPKCKIKKVVIVF